jgi:GNAT superfamily N-acetyltransferase
VTTPQPRIERVDPADPAAFAPFHDVYVASSLHDRAGRFTPAGAEGEREGFRRADDSVEHLLFLATGTGGTPVAAGRLRRELTANRHLATLAIDVHPAHRRRGHGSAMLAHLEGVAASAGHTTLVAETAVPPDAAVEESGQYAFAAGHGYRLALHELRRRLDLPAKADLAALAASAAEYHEGYRLVPFQDRTPDAYLAGWAQLMTLISVESPVGDLNVGQDDPNPGLVRQREAARRAQGRSDFGVVALSPEGEVVAVTRMVQEHGDPAKLGQGGTLVRRDHRGHRLGLAVKVANLRQLGASYTSVTTWNAAANGPMIAINDALGFYVIEQGATYQKLIAAA